MYCIVYRKWDVWVMEWQSFDADPDPYPTLKLGQVNTWKKCCVHCGTAPIHFKHFKDFLMHIYVTNNEFVHFTVHIWREIIQIFVSKLKKVGSGLGSGKMCRVMPIRPDPQNYMWLWWPSAAIQNSDAWWPIGWPVCEFAPWWER